MGPFSIFTLIPRSKVTLVSTVEEVSAAVLVVEEDESAAEPLQYLVEESEVLTVERIALYVSVDVTFNFVAGNYNGVCK